jgi:hypothetical protein
MRQKTYENPGRAKRRLASNGPLIACLGKGLRFRDDAKCDDEIRLLRRRDSGSHLCRTADPHQLGGLAFAIRGDQPRSDALSLRQDDDLCRAAHRPFFRVVVLVSDCRRNGKRDRHGGPHAIPKRRAGLVIDASQINDRALRSRLEFRDCTRADEI